MSLASFQVFSASNQSIVKDIMKKNAFIASSKIKKVTRVKKEQTSKKKPVQKQPKAETVARLARPQPARLNDNALLNTSSDASLSSTNAKGQKRKQANVVSDTKQSSKYGCGKARDVPPAMTASTSDIHWHESIPVYEENTKDFFNGICKSVANVKLLIDKVRSVVAQLPEAQREECGEDLNTIKAEVQMMLKMCAAEQVRCRAQINMMCGVVNDVEVQMDKQVHAICEHMKQVVPAKASDVLVNVIRFENGARALSNQIGFTCLQAQPPTI